MLSLSYVQGLVASDDTRPSPIRIELKRDTVSDQDLDPVQTHFAGKVREDAVPTLKLHTKKSVRKRLFDDAFGYLGFGHIGLRVQQ